MAGGPRCPGEGGTHTPSSCPTFETAALTRSRPTGVICWARTLCLFGRDSFRKNSLYACSGPVTVVRAAGATCALCPQATDGPMEGRSLPVLRAARGLRSPCHPGSPSCHLLGTEGLCREEARPSFAVQKAPKHHLHHWPGPGLQFFYSKMPCIKALKLRSKTKISSHFPTEKVICFQLRSFTMQPKIIRDKCWLILDV